MTSKEDLLADLERPERLEARYRADPERFTAALHAAHAERPGSIVLEIWFQRLFYRPHAESAAAARPARASLGQLLVLCLAIALLAQLPQILPIEEEWYYSRFGASLALLGPIAYYLLQVAAPAGLQRTVLAACAVAACGLALLPTRARSDSLRMALIHAPLFVGSLLALSFLGERWREAEQRMAYVRYCGELFVIAVLLLLGGIVLSAMTLGLFSLIHVNMDWYFEWVVVSGLVCAPLVATHLYETVFERRVGLARMLASVFSPLFLVMVSIYLLAMIASGKNPYQEREFLIVFNGLLLLVLGMTIFSLAERERDSRIGLSDYVSSALIALTLGLDAIALSAILFRLGTQGWTANRAAVLGSNLLVFVQLLRLARCHWLVMRGSCDFSALDRAIAGYLPIYSGWSALVLLGFPLLFRFR